MDKIYETANEQHVAAPVLYISATGSGTTILYDDRNLYSVPPVSGEDGVIATADEVDRWFYNNGVAKMILNGVYNDEFRGTKPVYCDLYKDSLSEEQYVECKLLLLAGGSANLTGLSFHSDMIS